MQDPLYFILFLRVVLFLFDNLLIVVERALQTVTVFFVLFCESNMYLCYFCVFCWKNLVSFLYSRLELC